MTEFLYKIRAVFNPSREFMEGVKFFLVHYYFFFLSAILIILLIGFILSVKSIARAVGRISSMGWFLAFLIFSVALFVRVMVLSHHPQVFMDEVTFIETAENYYQEGLNRLKDYGWDRNEFLICATGWSYIISLGFRLMGVHIKTAFYLSSVLSALSVLLIFFLASFLFKNEKVGLWSSLIFSVMPVYLRVSTSSAMETPSVFFVLWTFIAFCLYFRYKTNSLLYFAFMSLAYTINIRQEAFVTLLPLFLLFFFLFNPRCGDEFRNVHFYINMVLLLIFALPPALASFYGVSTGFYYFYESPEAIHRHIMMNLQYNFTYWFSSKIQPLSLFLLFLAGLGLFFKIDRKLTLYFVFWFVFLYVFYTLNPSCDFAVVQTLDSWRTVVHLLIPLCLFAGIPLMMITEYFREHFPAMTGWVSALLILGVLSLPFQFGNFITEKTIWAKDNIFISEFSRKIPPNSRIILEGNMGNRWGEYQALFDYTSAIPGRKYLLAMNQPETTDQVIEDFLKWKYGEKRPVYLYLTAVTNEDMQEDARWYMDTFFLRTVAGFGSRKNKKSFTLYEITGLRMIPPHIQIRREEFGKEY